jgi:hypothetical protein
MKKIYLAIGLILVVLNTIIGLIFSGYSTFNFISSDIVIIINTLLLSAIANSKISDGFKVSFSFIFPLLGFVSFILACIMDNKLNDNILLTGVLIISTIQITLLIFTSLLKKTT